MKMKITTASSIIGVPGVDLDISMVIVALQKYMEELGQHEPRNWTLVFKLFFRKSDWIGVFRRNVVYRSTLEREVSIAIPIPSSNEIYYGVSPKRYTYQAPMDISKYWPVSVDYSSFSSLQQLINWCSVRGIEEALVKGDYLKGGGL